MTLPDESWLLRIHCGESDRHGRLPVYEAVVRKAHELGLAGATVLRGSMGFGAGSRIHTAKVLRLSEDLPVVVEIIDARAKIDELLPHVEVMTFDGLVTLERVRVVQHRTPADRA
jgi:hypothetical protein